MFLDKWNFPNWELKRVKVLNFCTFFWISTRAKADHVTKSVLFFANGFSTQERPSLENEHVLDIFINM